MKSLLFLSAALATFAFASLAHAEETPVYELRIYTTNEGKLDDLNARFRDHTVKLFEKHGMKNMGYWTPTDPALKDNTLIYILQHKSRDAAKKSWAAFSADPDWQKAKAASEENGKIVSKAESVYMNETDFSPHDLENGSNTRLFELRKYTCAEGRLPNLHQRFRDGELDLFTKAGMQHIFYFEPTDTPGLLIYVVAHKDDADAKKSWASFRGDPEWIKMRDASEADGPIVTKVESTMMVPTDYSALK
ncbi:NIPSNAP family protein [Blastopirellula sp. JC732]|uniref:NIPSNAP family protein n=1 Tax=Blastopirellula sediminis TaxID=2894196 RepID=A0A9X1MK00_9BACT|nr:NIPSNAP family protein [Blastopirellula sediminis]MCC9609077.1 NIPSNAP family protein [Blastopirellula sediminis]MCC9628146.1 NIPSNAP family protein [Blastopirellula sediminis]